MSALFIVLAGLSLGSEPAAAEPFILGVDISALEQVEEGGGIFSDDGIAGDAIDIFREHGVNYIRLRLWHSPSGETGSLDSALRLAARGREAGMGLLLDIHYSDDWADPNKQYKPGVWEGLPFEALADSVRAYTSDVIGRFWAAGVLPEIVQIGNEISCGLLWNDGKVCGTLEADTRWRNLAALVNAGIEGVKDGAGSGEMPRIMIHYDDGGDNSRCRWFFDKLAGEGVGFDIIGLSFYPWWHGTLDDLSANLDDLAARYGKVIIIVETAYPWTLGWFDDEHNLVGLEGQLHDGFDASVDGQRKFIEKVIETVEGIEGGRGIGFFYWAPEWISAPGASSPWENMTLFDFSGSALYSIGAFE
jgi:arabinogalactan endo-1,4-beta-galactosidase